MQKTAIGRGNISKTLFAMKLTIILLTAAFIQVQASGVAQMVSVKGRQLPMKKIISAIEEQTDYVVFCNKEVMAMTRPVSVSATQMPLTDLLKTVLKDQPVDFLIKDKTIVLYEKKAPPLLAPPGIMDSVETLFLPITGVIRGADGQVLGGASVTVRGSNVSTVTRDDGSFSIQAKEGDVLVISFVGYTNKEYRVNAASMKAEKVLTISLELADNKMNEMIIVGYGTRTKGAVTGAISTVKGEVFENRPLNNSFDALQGTVPGMIITRSSGQPGN